MSLFAKDHYTFSLIFYPAPFAINWSTPGSLLRSSIFNTFFGFKWNYDVDFDLAQLKDRTFIKKINMIQPFIKHPHPISHVDIALENPQGQLIMTGMSRIREFSEITSALLATSTFDKLTKNYKGRLKDQAQVECYFKRALLEGKVNWLTFIISQELYQRLTDYFYEYQKKNFHQVYAGFTAKVRSGEGAGCAYFAQSFLEIAGLDQEEIMNKWSFPLNIPNSLMPPSPDSSFEAKWKNFCKIWQMILLGRNEKWGTSETPGTKIQVLDPFYFYEFINKTLNSNATWIHQQKHKILNAKGLIINKLDHPTPKFNYWLT